MTTIIRISRPPGANGPEDPGETFLEGDVEDTSVYTEMQDELTKLHENKD